MKLAYRIASIPLVVVFCGHLLIAIALDDFKCKRVRSER